MSVIMSVIIVELNKSSREILFYVYSKDRAVQSPKLYDIFLALSNFYHSVRRLYFPFFIDSYLISFGPSLLMLVSEP